MYLLGILFCKFHPKRWGGGFIASNNSKENVFQDFDFALEMKNRLAQVYVSPPLPSATIYAYCIPMKIGYSDRPINAFQLKYYRVYNSKIECTSTFHRVSNQNRYEGGGPITVSDNGDIYVISTIDYTCPFSTILSLPIYE